MKVGSLVECVDSNLMDYCVVSLTEKDIYTVRHIQKGATGIMQVLLHEIQNATCPVLKQEYGYRASRFRELQPPMDLSELIEETVLTTQTNSHE